VQIRDTSLFEIRNRQALHQLVHAPGRHAAHIGLLHHRQQCLLTAPTRLQEAREIAALPQLGDLQLDLPRTRVPAPRPIAIAMRGTVRAALTQRRADQLADLDLHELAHQPPQRLANKVRALIAAQQLDDLSGRHPLPLGHRGAPSDRQT